MSNYIDRLNLTRLEISAIEILKLKREVKKLRRENRILRIILKGQPKYYDKRITNSIRRRLQTGED